VATVLITGFGPFPGAPNNPSALLVERLARVRRPAFAAHKLVTHVFATSYTAVDENLPALVRRHRPQAIIMFGLAGRTPYLRIETRARNRVSQLFADAARAIPAPTIVKRTVSHRIGCAPFARLMSAARATGINTRLSRNAGTYVCNYVYWRALEAASVPKGPRLAVFVHVPKLRGGGQAHRRQPTLNQLTRAAEAIVAACLAATRRD
jgi:pyroglutamyl-peptidase